MTNFDVNWHKWSMGKGMKWSSLRSGGQKSRSDEAEVRFGGLEEASFTTPISRVALLVSVIFYIPALFMLTM